MDTKELVAVLSQALALTTLLSLMPIVAATVVGVVVSVFQALTQIQEQNVAFTAKLIVIIAVLWAGGGYMSAQLLDYTDQIFSSLY